MPRRDRYTPVSTRHGTCETCGEPTITRNGITTHTVVGRGELWQGTLAELIDCDSSRIADGA